MIVQKKTLVIIGILFTLIIVMGAGSYLSSGRAAPTYDMLTFGTAPVESAGLIYLAEDQGFFRDNGLNVKIREYDSGSVAFKGMIQGETDIAGTAEYPVVGAVFNREKIQVLGIIDRYQTNYLAGRKDRGIRDIPDLRGKRIGVTQGTIREFYVGRFLNLHGIELQEVTVVNIPAAQSVDAITNGSVDAIVHQGGVASTIRENLGGNGVFWPVQSSQMGYSVVAAREDWVGAHPYQARRFLQALADAEEYAISQPAEAKAILQKRLHLTGAYLDDAWPENQFVLSLDQSLIIAMEDEARWMIRNNVTDATTVPDFRQYLYTGGLDAVKPGAVTVIR